MDDSQRLFWIAFRASLLQEAKTLQDMRAAKLAIASDVKRLLDAPTHDPPKETPAIKT